MQERRDFEIVQVDIAVEYQDPHIVGLALRAKPTENQRVVAKGKKKPSRGSL